MCVQFLHMVSIDVPASVGAPPLNTTSNDTLYWQGVWQQQFMLYYYPAKQKTNLL